MTRHTSIKAYTKIRNEGLLSHRRWQVYHYVYCHGPTTARQAWKDIDRRSATGSIVTRFSELKRMGLLEEAGETIDPETNMTVLLWDVTENLPRKLKDTKEATRNELIAALCANLEAALSAWSQKTEWYETCQSLLRQSAKYRKAKK